MVNKNGLVKIFVKNCEETLEDEVNKWLEDNPGFYIDNMQFFVHKQNNGVDIYYVVCNFLPQKTKRWRNSFNRRIVKRFNWGS